MAAQKTNPADVFGADRPVTMVMSLLHVLEEDLKELQRLGVVAHTFEDEMYANHRRGKKRYGVVTKSMDPLMALRVATVVVAALEGYEIAGRELSP